MEISLTSANIATIPKRDDTSGANPNATAAQRCSVIAWLLLLNLLGGTAASGAPGEVDPTFGTMGSVSTPISPFYAFPTVVRVQADGRIVVAGSMRFAEATAFLMRYNSDGTLDATFGSGGVVSVGAGLREDGRPSDLLIRPDGTIIIVTPKNGLIVVSADGTLREIIRYAGSSSEIVGGAVLRQDGTVLIVSSRDRSDAPRLFHNDGIWLSRYMANGQLDPNFGSEGRAFRVLSTGPGEGSSTIALAPSGKVFTAGYFPGLTITRWDPYGRPERIGDGVGRVVSQDGEFGTGGTDVAIQRDGKIVLSGFELPFQPQPLTIHRFVLAKFNADGTPDQGFGTGGLARSILSDSQTITGFSPGPHLVLQPDDKVLVNDVALGVTFRYTTDGRLDPTFCSVW